MHGGEVNASTLVIEEDLTLHMEAGTNGAVARKPWREAGTLTEDWFKYGEAGSFVSRDIGSGDACQQRDFVSLTYVGISRAVLMLVEAANGLRGRLTHADLAGNLRSPLAARADHFRIVLFLLKPHLHRFHQAPGKGPAGQYVAHEIP